jgi:hypothetical protein
MKWLKMSIIMATNSCRPPAPMSSQAAASEDCPLMMISAAFSMG